MKFTGETKLFIAIIAVTAVIIGLASLVLTKPAPALTRGDLVPEGAHTKGNTEARVYLVEFSDFQCSACLAFKPTVDAIIQSHKDKLLYVYRHFPLDQHPYSHTAAYAAEAAGLQGKYWEMFDLLFANQAKFSDSIFAELAAQLQLDPEKFAGDLKSSSVAGRIQEDLAYGNRIGINATPTFFLNGEKLELTGFDDLTRAVEEAIKNTP
jgi:protein-disulfide isomerase